MKKTFRSIMSAAAVLAALLPGCVKDKMYHTYTITTEEYVIKPKVIEAARLQAPRTMSNTGSFAVYGNLMLITEQNAGIHVIDYSNRAAPETKGFIPLPGTTGLAVKNGILYADCYCDLFVFRLSDGGTVEYQRTVRNVFLSRMQYAYDTSYVDVILHKRDTTVNDRNYSQSIVDMRNVRPEAMSASPLTANPLLSNSVGSSMSLFAIISDYLYTLDNSNLSAFSLQDLTNPEKTGSAVVSAIAESMFPCGDKLFIGTQTGMFVYDLTNPSMPSFLCRFNHARVCDPVIADKSHAFVTLRTGNRCNGSLNQLDVLDVSDINNPVLLKSYPFSNPHGLSKDRSVLFICDGAAGLKMIDASDVNNLITKKTVDAGTALDVVAMGDVALVTASDGIRIYAYDQQFNISQLGSIQKK